MDAPTKITVLGIEFQLYFQEEGKWTTCIIERGVDYYSGTSRWSGKEPKSQETGRKRSFNRAALGWAYSMSWREPILQGWDTDMVYQAFRKAYWRTQFPFWCSPKIMASFTKELFNKFYGMGA